MSETCRYCKHWLPYDHDDLEQAGQCHANAPSPILQRLLPPLEDATCVENEDEESGTLFVWWPETPADEFCGQFTPRPDESASPAILNGKHH